MDHHSYKIWELLGNIAYFEEYKENANPPESVLKVLLRKIEKLNNDDSEFSSDELDSYAGKLNYDSIVTVFTKTVTLLYNCEKLQKDAEDLEKRGKQDELAILYFDILHTQDKNIVESEYWNDSSNKNTLPCVGIRKTAFDWCKSYLEKKSDMYLSALKSADYLFARKQYDEAQKRYEDADILCKSLSLYPKYMSDSIDKIFNRKKIDFEKEANKIAYRMYQSNISTPGMLNQRLETIANSNKEISLKFYQKNSVWKEWFTEVRYRKGKYFSANDELIAENLAMTLNQIYQELGPNIASISIDFTGSADNASFISDEPIKLFHPEYEKLQDEVCQCLKPRQPIEDQICFPFQELRYGKLGSKPQKGSLRKIDNNFLKNNALAFLRAYHRKTLVERYLLNGCIPRDKLTYGICSVVSEQIGEEFRYVNVEIHINFKE